LSTQTGRSLSPIAMPVHAPKQPSTAASRIDGVPCGGSGHWLPLYDRRQDLPGRLSRSLVPLGPDGESTDPENQRWLSIPHAAVTLPVARLCADRQRG
jgi:hypothetical protein